MRRRILVLLNIKGSLYKFLSIFQNKTDPSSYIYQHIKNEESPVTIADPIHLLKVSGTFNTDKINKKSERSGDKIHLSLHPKRIYLKRLNTDGRKEHLIEEYEPQPFNANHFRLHVIYTPPPISHMEEYSLKSRNKSLEEVVFNWESEMCPQISIYELENVFKLDDIHNLLPPAERIHTIPNDGTHPTIVLHLKKTNGQPGIWLPQCSIFGRIVKKKPISKKDLQNILDYNNLKIDISSIPDNAVITDYKMENADKLS